MVSINLTLLVQLVLFAIFLVVTHYCFLKPALELMDRREAKVENDETRAEQHRFDAERLEAYYGRELSSARRLAAERIEQARRRALEERWRLIAEHKRETEREIEKHRHGLQEQLAEEREHYGALVPEIEEAIARRLSGPGGRLN